MTDIRQIPIRHIHLGADSQTVAAGYAPLFPDLGKTRINQYIDTDKNGSVDYVILNRSPKDSKVLFTTDFQKSKFYPAVLGSFDRWKREYVGNSPCVQDQFTTQISSATKTYEEFEGALKQDLVKDGPAPKTYSFKDSQGHKLSVENVRDQMIGGKLRVIGLTIGKEDGTQITVEDPKLLQRVQAQLDNRFISPDSGRPAAQNRAHRAERSTGGHIHHQGRRLAER